MKLADHVLKAIDAFERNEKDSALMHATIAIDATARNLLKKEEATGSEYKDCIRKYFWIVERFIGEGLNLEDTKFTHLKLTGKNNKPILAPDLADVVYHIFRCNSAHAKEIPKIYHLLPAQDGRYPWAMDFANNALNMPETIIWALLAISIFCEANIGVISEGEYFITWGNSNIGTANFLIKDHWGKEKELYEFFQERPTLRVKLENL